MDCRAGSDFDAAVIAVDRLMPADLCILEAIRFLLGREDLDILAQCALIAFEREDVIGLLIQDLLGNRLSSGRSGGASCRRWRSHPPGCR